jgi:hypothetical protein
MAVVGGLRGGDIELRDVETIIPVRRSETVLETICRRILSLAVLSSGERPEIC